MAISGMYIVVTLLILFTNMSVLTAQASQEDQGEREGVNKKVNLYQADKMQ